MKGKILDKPHGETSYKIASDLLKDSRSLKTKKE
jgi:hypothetical protein